MEILTLKKLMAFLKTEADAEKLLLGVFNAGALPASPTRVSMGVAELEEVTGLDEDQIVDALRGLFKNVVSIESPRSETKFSLVSSFEAMDDEIAFTLNAVFYQLYGEMARGLTAAGLTVEVKRQS